MDARVVVKPNTEACRCLGSTVDEVFDSGKAAGLALQQSIDRYTEIIEWETRTLRSAPPKAYLKLCMALFQDAADENAAIYLSGYETILNKISVRHGRAAARKLLVVLRYAKKALGSVVFPSDISRHS